MKEEGRKERRALSRQPSLILFVRRMRGCIMVVVVLWCYGCSGLWLTQIDAVRIATKDAERRHIRLPERYSVAVCELEVIPEMVAPYAVYQVQFSEPRLRGSKKLFRYTIYKSSGEVEGIIDSQKDVSMIR